MLPGWWAFTLLVLATYRVVRIIGWDNAPLIIRIRGWITGAELVTNGSTNARLGVTNEDVISSTRYRRPTLDHFLGCPFCQGFYVSLAAYGAWLLAGAPGAVGSSSWAWYLAAPLALSAAVGLVAKNLDA